MKYFLGVQMKSVATMRNFEVPCVEFRVVANSANGCYK